MAARRARQSAATAESAEAAEPQLPIYQPPSAPLNATAQEALRKLQNDNLTKLSEHFKAVNESLANSVFDIQEALYNQQESAAKRIQKFGETDPRNKTRIGMVEDLTEKVNTKTMAIETKVRQTIDAQERMRVQDEAFKQLSANAINNNGRVNTAPTQSTLGASQFRPRQENDDNDDDEDEPTTPQEPGLQVLLKQKIDQHEQNYAALPMPQRYAEHNDYVAFRRQLHEGHYAHLGEALPIMPAARTWFDENGPVLEPESQVDATQEDGQDDSDVEAVAEKTNVKCPITLAVMTDPVMTGKCPHRYERSAIEEMLKFSHTRVGGGRTGPQTVQCPQCEVTFTKADLKPDTGLKRRIERITATQARNDRDDEEDDEDEYDGESAARARTVDSQFEPNFDHLTQIKAERASGVGRQNVMDKQEDEEDERPLRPPISTAEVVDLQDDDED